MTREPKDYEIWYVKLPDGSIKPAVAFIPPNPKNTVWYIDGDTCCADPIAPVLSHELVAELVEALNQIEYLDRPLEYLDRPQVRGLPRRISIHAIATTALAKARAAGLGVQS